MSILVVCTANVARSPLAEAMLAASLADVEVVSAGTHAGVGDPAAGRSRKLATIRALDLGDHRSRPVTADLLHGADLVITMAAAHRDRCAQLSGEVAGRTFTLREVIALCGDLVHRGTGSDPAALAAGAAERRHRTAATVHTDVHDPIADPWPAWATMGATLDELVGDLVRILGAEPGWRSPAAAAQASEPRWWHHLSRRA